MGRFILNKRYKHDLMNEGGELRMREVGDAVVRGTAGRARMRPYRSMMGVGVSPNPEDGVTVHAGTASSFAHWEEFGGLRWKGPTGPMRATIRSMGFSKIEWDGPNSMRAPLS